MSDNANGGLEPAYVVGSKNSKFIFSFEVNNNNTGMVLVITAKGLVKRLSRSLKESKGKSLMRQGQQNRRNRGRGRSSNNNRSSNPLSRNYESNGPEVKIKGSAAHIAEKYMTLARDALSSGNTVTAENYFQHAEHYNRIIQAAQAKQEEQAAAQASRTETAKPAARPHDRRPPRQRTEGSAAPEKSAEPIAPAGTGKQPSLNGNGAENEPAAEKPKRKPRPRKPKVAKAEASENSEAQG